MENQVLRTARTGCTCREFLFYLYFAIMLLTKGFGLADGRIYKLALLASGGLVLLKLISDGLNAVQWMIVIMLLILGVLDMRLAGNQAVMVCVLAVLSVRGIDLRRAFGMAAGIWGGAMVLQILWHLLHLETTDFVIHNKAFTGYIIRWSLGYVHPNVLMITCCVFLFYLYYALDMRGRRTKLIIFLTALLGAAYLFLYSVSLTGVILFILFYAFLLYFEANRKWGRTPGRIEQFLLLCIFPSAVFLSVVVPFLFEGEALYQFSRLFTHRPRLSRYFMENYGIALLGRSFPELPSSITLDCAYVNLLEYGGVLSFALMCIAYWLLIRRLLSAEPDRTRSVSLAMTFAVLIAAMSEPFAFNTSYKNPTLFLIGMMLYEKTDGFSCRSLLPDAAAAWGDRCIPLPAAAPIFWRDGIERCVQTAEKQVSPGKNRLVRCLAGTAAGFLRRYSARFFSDFQEGCMRFAPAVIRIPILRASI